MTATTKPQERKIKVGYLPRRKSKYVNQFYFSPKIMLTGNWLTGLGFKVGDSVLITATDNRLVIVKEEGVKNAR